MPRHAPAFALAALLAAAAGCATAPPSERERQRLADYEAAAGEPVHAFRFFHLTSWEPLGRDAVAIHTRPGEAWLLGLAGPCNELPFAQEIGLTSSANQVSARFDSVRVARSPIPCRIDTIRPVDVASLRESRAERRRVTAEPRPADGTEG